MAAIVRIDEVRESAIKFQYEGARFTQRQEMNLLF